MGWLTLISVALNACITLLFGYITARRLETHKRELDRLTYEHQVKYSQMYQKRVEIIEELYRQLSAVFLTVGEITAPGMANFDDAPVPKEKNEEFDALVRTVTKYYYAHRIYLEQSLCEKLDRFIAAAKLVTESYQLWRECPESGADKDWLYKYTGELIELITEVALEIESEFRAFHGISNESTKDEEDEEDED